MPSLNAALPAAQACREPLPENARDALASALWQTCRAEAETMWNELHLRLRADESRKDSFVDFMTRNLMNKMTRKRRARIFPASTDQRVA